MPILSGGPLSTFPISGADAFSPPAADDSIAVQMTAVDDGTALYGDPDDYEGFDYQGQQLAPLADFVSDPEIGHAHFVDPIWIIDEDEWTPDWAQAPPHDAGEETGQTTGQRSNNDWVDEDEPIIEGWTAGPLDDTPVATVDDVGPQELGQIWDDDEPVTDGQLGSPLEDAPVATVDDVGPQELGQIWEDDEPVIEGWTSRAYDNEEYTRTPVFEQCVDEDEPVTDGQLGSPLEDAPVVDNSVLGRTLGNDIVFDEDDVPVEFWLATPLEDGPVVPVPPADFPGGSTGAGLGSGDPGFGMRTSMRLPVPIDDLRRLERLRILEKRKKEAENERRKRLLVALIHALDLFEE